MKIKIPTTILLTIVSLAFIAKGEGFLALLLWIAYGIYKG